MDSIVNKIMFVSKTYPFEGGVIGIVVGLLLLGGLIYLFINRNHVMTISYGLTLLSMVIFLLICIFALLFTSVYSVINCDKIGSGNFYQKISTAALFLILSLPIFVVAQGINYPNNSPINNGGAGNARTDPDNLFTRNNAAAMTEIENEENSKAYPGRWRVMSEYHATFYKYRRKYTPFGFNQTVKSQDSLILPTGSGEMTYTSENRRWAFGVGISQTFGFQSKMKDDEKVLGAQATFIDSKIASNDISIAVAHRLNNKLSVGGSFIVGRAFIFQTAPIQQLAAIGVIRNSRLDVNQIGGAGASFNLHLRPSEKFNIGFNFKTPRKYDLQGTLDTVQPAVTAQGLQLLPIRLNVRAPLKLPSIAESGVKFHPNEKVFFAFDYRFYNYSDALDRLNIFEKTSNSILASQVFNAKDVHLISFGGIYKWKPTVRIMFGSGYQNNALSDSAFTPALNNAGGISFSGGISTRAFGTWMNVGLTTIFSINRTIPTASQNTFPGKYRANGITVGYGFRW